jgi:hypothetical protein
MDLHFLAKGLAVGEHNLGRGVFAETSFAAGELLAVWGGRIISTEEIGRLAEAERAYVIQVEDDLHLLTPRPDVASADFINHSCEPNSGLSSSVSLVALRPIGAGEEICYDYAMSDSNPFLDFPCHCGSPQCRGHVTGEDWRRADVQARYGAHFSPYLKRRLEPGLRLVPAPTELRPRRPRTANSRPTLRRLLNEA